MERKIIHKRTEERLKCPYCGTLNPLGSSKCNNCGGVLSDAETKSILSESSTETTSIQTNFDEVDKSVSKAIGEASNRVIFVLVVFLLVIIGAIVWFTSDSPNEVTTSHTETTQDSNPTKKDSDTLTVTIAEKCWAVSATYTSESANVQVGYVLPNGATLLSQRQVPDEDNPALYRTEYTYTLDKVEGSYTYSGSDKDPIVTAEQIEKEKSCRVLEYSLNYSVKIESDTYSGTVSVEKDFWDSVHVGQEMKYNPKNRTFTYASIQWKFFQDS